MARSPRSRHGVRRSAGPLSGLAAIALLLGLAPGAAAIGPAAPGVTADAVPKRPAVAAADVRAETPPAAPPAETPGAGTDVDGADADGADADGAYADGADADGADAADPAASAPQLIIAPQAPVLDPEAESYSFTVLLRNPSGTALPGGLVQLRLDTERILGEQALDALASSDTAAADAGFARGALLAETRVAELAAGDERSLSIRVPRAVVPFGVVSESGVFAVHAELREAADDAADDTGDAAGDAAGTPTGGAAADENGADASAPGVTADAASRDAAPSTPALRGSSAIVWRGANDGARLALTTIVPLVLPAAIDGMPSTGELADLVPRFSQLLDAAERWRATVAVDPRFIAGVRAYGDAAPAPARTLLARLETASVRVFMLQFADADPAAQAALGLTELLQPKGLDYLTREGIFPEADDGDPAAGDSAVPTLGQLLDWPRGEAMAWPAANEVTPATLGLLGASGIGSVILESGNVTGAEHAARATLDGFDALIADAGLDRAARAAITATTEPERAAGAAELAARLTLAAEDDQRDGMVLALDRGTIADAAAPAEVFTTLDAMDWIVPTSAALQASGTARLSEAGATAQSGDSTAEPGGANRTEQLAAAMERSDRIDALAPLLDHPEYLPEYQRVRLLSVFATRYAPSGVASEAAAERFAARDAELLEGLQVVPSENTQLISTSSRVPILVHNALPFDALVTVKVAPLSASIRVPTRTFERQAVAAGANSTVLVPVDSRVSSGDAWLSVFINDAADEATFSRVQLHLTIRSGVEGILLTVLGALAALLFGFGIWRSLRRHRIVGVSEAPAAEPNARTGEEDPPTKPTAPPAE
ncbi:MAG: hypothetical protein KDB25_10275 [Leucobacter sp.]|nr:hypothetical protein [Leucobacter sp.]